MSTSFKLEVILSIGNILISVLNLVLFIKQVKRTNLVEKNNKKIQEINLKLGTILSKTNTTNSRILMAFQNQENRIKCLEAQMAQVHEYLGKVLGVSKLIFFDDSLNERIDIIEELRQRVKWAEEIEKQQTDDSDFYKGD
ncbi:hypothetical protein QT972_00120 [Microcoleus sp. herbarium7]|uniref:hypothetical protein n=1 Tax=Microcoleus sp. herbarium7 TaxID=3055435 RepID=UPI002FD21B62